MDSPLAHLNKDCHICTATGLSPAHISTAARLAQAWKAHFAKYKRAIEVEKDKERDKLKLQVE
jgi:hypothetical protein